MIEQTVDQKLFTDSSRPACIVQRLEFIERLALEEKHKPVISPVDQPEPIYTGLPIKLIKKRKLDLLDIETQQVGLVNRAHAFLSRLYRESALCISFVLGLVFFGR